MIEQNITKRPKVGVFSFLEEQKSSEIQVQDGLVLDSHGDSIATLAKVEEHLTGA